MDSQIQIFRRRVLTFALFFAFIFSTLFFMRQFLTNKEEVFAVVPGISQSNGKIENFYKDLAEKYGDFDTIVLITPNTNFDKNAYYEAFPENGKYCYKDGQDLKCINGTAFSTEFYNGVTYGKLFEKKEGIYMVNEPTLGKQFSYINTFFPETKRIYGLILQKENEESLSYKKMRNAILS